MRRGLALVIEGSQHLRLAVALGQALSEAGFRVSLISPSVSDEQMLPEHFCHVVTDIYAVPGFLQEVGLLLFLTNESSPFCMFSNKVALAAELTGTPALAIQHGWIQPGLNFKSATRRVGYVGRGVDNSRAIVHFARVLRYDGEDGIGYPLLKSEARRMSVPSSATLRVLVATNFNWGVYARESIAGFLRALTGLRVMFPGMRFSHRGHPAEQKQGITAELGLHLDVLSIEAAPNALEEALNSADVVVSTPSTIALDAIAAGVPAFVFCPPEFAEVRGLVGYPAFQGVEDLQLRFRRLLSESYYERPPIKAFDPESLLRHITTELTRTAPYALSCEDYVRFAGLVKTC